MVWCNSRPWLVACNKRGRGRKTPRFLLPMTDLDSTPVRSRANANILVKTQQPLTVVEGQTSDGTLFIVPDTPQAYGDEASVVALTEDLVGRNTDSNEEAKAAGLIAGEQFNSDIRLRMERIRRQQFHSKHPAAMQFTHRDNAGVVTGVTLLFALWNPETEQTEHIERHFDAGELMGQALASGRSDLVKDMMTQ